MQQIFALPRGSGDYVHSGEEIQIVDEATGTTYELIVKGGASHPGEKGSVFIHIPARCVVSVELLDGHCVLELAEPNDEADTQSRFERLKQCIGGKP